MSKLGITCFAIIAAASFALLGIVVGCQGSLGENSNLNSDPSTTGYYTDINENKGGHIFTPTRKAKPGKEIDWQGIILKVPDFPIDDQTIRRVSRIDYPVVLTGSAQWDGSEGVRKGLFEWAAAGVTFESDASILDSNESDVICWAHYKVGDLSQDSLESLALTGGTNPDGSTYDVLIANWSEQVWDIYRFSSNNFDNGLIDLSQHSDDYVSPAGNLNWVIAVLDGVEGFVDEWQLNGSLNEWVHTWGGSALDASYGMAIDASGNLYAVGETTSFGAGNYDALLLKYSPSGVLLKSATWGGSQLDSYWDVALDTDGNVYCAGYTASFGAGQVDSLLVKYSLSGDTVWAKTWGGAGIEYSAGIVVDAGNNLYVTGRTNSFGAGDYDMYLLKYSSDGELQWAKTWGGVNEDFGRLAAVDAGGFVYMSGHSYSFSAGSSDFVLLKWSSEGEVVWEKTWGGSGNDGGYGIEVDSNGDVIIVGHTESYGAGGGDAIVLKYTNDGEIVWARTWGGSGEDISRVASVDSAGNIYIAGRSNSFGGGTLDVLMLKYTTDGDLVWKRTWGSGNVNRGLAILPNSGNIVYLVGWAPNASGVFFTPGGSESTPLGTEGAPSGTVTSPNAAIGSPTGSESFPTGVEDVGAGGNEALAMKLVVLNDD